MAAGQAKAEALARAEQLTKRLAEEQQKQQQRVASEISEVKEAATTATTKLGEVSGEVGTVKTEIASTKSELERTIADLKKVTGDLGVQSGYIATNSKELGALKRLGERNYFEFKLGKTKQPQRVGDITVLLKKADPKRNKYTIEVMADDKRTEKRDKNIFEPVQFYVAKARQPYEIVVNEVKKDQVAGYLATPKEQTPR
jgi:chromosome segregation ATPase